MTAVAGSIAVVVQGEPPAALGLPTRRALRVAEAALRDVLEALTTSRLVERTLLVSPDRRARGLAEGRGVEPAPVPEEGLSAALRRCTEALVAKGVPVLTLVRADLPLLKAEDVAFLVGRALRGPRLVVATSPVSRRAGLAVLHPSDILSPTVLAEDVGTVLEAAEARDVPWEAYGLEAALSLEDPDTLARVYHAARPSRVKVLLKRWRLGALREGGP